MENKKNESMIDGYKIRTFELPPEGFDPLTAEQSKLLYHGIVPRPDKDKEPELYKRWHAIYSKKLNYIIPGFKEINRKGHDDKGKAKSFGPYTPKTWSGVVVTPPAGKQFRTVEGYIPIPTLASIPNFNAALNEFVGPNFAAWIGIDGKDTSSDVLLQVGIDMEFAFAQVNVYYPIFCQWGNSSQQLINLGTNYGDTLNCIICADAYSNLSKAVIYITDLNNNNSTSFEITSPAGKAWEGKCAEWIVENVYGNENPPIPLSNLGEYTFTEQCTAAYEGPNGLINVNSGAGSIVKMPGTLVEKGTNSVTVITNFAH